MNVTFASTADLYAEHRRTQSRRKKLRIARELQRRHDELNTRPGYGNSWWQYAETIVVEHDGVLTTRSAPWQPVARYDFELLLP